MENTKEVLNKPEEVKKMGPKYRVDDIVFYNMGYEIIPLLISKINYNYHERILLGYYYSIYHSDFILCEEDPKIVEESKLTAEDKTNGYRLLYKLFKNK